MSGNNLGAGLLLGASLLSSAFSSPTSQNIQDNIIANAPSSSEVQNQEQNYCPIEKPPEPFREELDFGDLATTMERNQQVERDLDIAAKTDKPIACGAPDPHADIREAFGNLDSTPEETAEPIEPQETIV